MRRGVRNMLGTTMLRTFRGVAAAAVALAIPASVAAGASPGPVRVGHQPRLSTSAKVVGAVAAATPMHITVALKPRDPAALATFAREVSTPGSSLYRDYVTAGQFARQFGASSGQLRAVESSLRAHGLRPARVSPNRLSIQVTATAAQVEHAFSLSLQHVALGQGKEATVASAAPAIDAGIAGDVQAVLGLSSLTAPRPLSERPATAPSQRSALAPRATAHVATGGPQPCAAAGQAASQQGAYTADQIASAYGFSGLYGAGDDGQGQTIAVYELEPDDPNDIAGYQTCYGTNAPVSYLQIDGGAGSGAGSGEAALDIEDVIGLAPRANILVYQGPNSQQSGPGSGPYDVWSAIIGQDRAHVITTSWGQCEDLEGSSDAGAENTLFQEAAAQGQSIVSAAGDEGSEDCNDNDNLPNLDLAVDDPASQPFVTGVGGTSMSSLGPPPSETVWNGGGNAIGLLGLVSGAGGGGVSQLWRMPGYQTGASKSLHLLQADSSGSTCGASSGDCREVPDVSADADPNSGYIIYYNGSGDDPTQASGWQAVGGTSAAAPVWAALLADADSSSACHGSAIGFANPTLYAAATSAYASDFNDVVSGNNDYTGTNKGRFPAQVGYDMASGLGTPNAAALASPLCSATLRVISPGAQAATVGRPVSLPIRTSALAGTKLSYTASHLPPGLSIAGSSGRISGRPRQSGRWTTSVVARAPSGSLRGASFRWTVAGKPTLSGTSLTGVGGGHPELRLTVAAGRFAPALSAASIALPAGLRFTRSAVHVTVTGSRGKRIRFSSHLHGGRLQIKLPAARRRIRITVASGSIAASGGLAARVRSRRTRTIELTVAATDAKGRTTTVRSRSGLAA